MANVSNAIRAIRNANGTYDIRLKWFWHPAADVAHGWLLYIKSEDPDTYSDASDIETNHDTVIKLGTDALSHTLHGVDPTRRYSFAVAAFFNGSEGLIKQDLKAFQRSAIWDGIGSPPLPDQNDWLDFQAAAWVDLMAPRTNLDIVEEGSDAGGPFVIVDLTVIDRNDEGTTTYVRPARGFGDWETAGTVDMLVLHPFDSSTDTDVKPVGTNMAVKIYREIPTVILQYYSEGNESERVEEIRELILDQDRLPEIIKTNVTLPFDGNVDNRLLWWWGDDDVEYVKLYRITDIETGAETAIENPATPAEFEFDADGTFEITTLVSGIEQVYRVEPWGRGIDGDQALILSQRVTVRLDVSGELAYELILHFVEVDLSDRHGVTLTIQVNSASSGEPVEDATVFYTTTPLDEESWLELTTNSLGQVTTPEFDRPAPDEDMVLYFQAEKDGKISPIKEYTVDGDRIAELHDMAFRFDGAVSLEFIATGDDDVGGVKLELSEGVRFNDPAFDPDDLVIVHIENDDGEFYHSFTLDSNVTWYVRATAYDGFLSGAVAGSAGPRYYDSAMRLGTLATEIYDLQEVSRTETDSTWEFHLGDSVAQVHVMWEDNAYPNPADFNLSNPAHQLITATTPTSAGNPYSVVIPMVTTPGTIRRILFEALDEAAYSSDIERVELKHDVAVPPLVTVIPTTDGATLDVSVRVRSLQDSYPVVVQLYEVGSPDVLLDDVSIAEVDEGDTVLVLADLALSPTGISRYFRITATDSEGLITDVWFNADRDNIPSAVIAVEENRARPKIKVDIDDDVNWLRITTPSLKTKTWTSEDVGWTPGGEFIYQVGVTLLDDASLESDLAFGEARGKYKVEVGDNDQPPVLVGYAILHGPAIGAVPPYLVIENLNLNYDYPVNPGADYDVVIVTYELDITSYNVENEVDGVIEKAYQFTDRDGTLDPVTLTWVELVGNPYHDSLPTPGLGQEITVYYRAKLTVEDLDLYSDVTPFRIDPDEIPRLRAFIGLNDDQNQVVIRWEGDDDVLSVGITPEGGTVRYVNGTAGTDSEDSIAVGETKAYTIVGYHLEDGLGVPSGPIPLTITRSADDPLPFFKLETGSDGSVSIKAVASTVVKSLKWVVSTVPITDAELEASENLEEGNNFDKINVTFIAPGETAYGAVKGYYQTDGTEAATNLRTDNTSIISNDVRAAPRFDVASQIVEGAIDIKVYLRSDVDKVMNASGSLVRFTRLDTNEESVVLVPVTANTSVPYYPKSYVVGLGDDYQVKVEAVYRKADDEYTTVLLKTISVVDDGVPRITVGATEFTYRGTIRYKWYRRNAHPASLKFISRRSGAFENSAATKALVLASGQVVYPVSLEFKFDSDDDAPEIGGTIYWAAVPIKIDGTAGPLVVGSSTRTTYDIVGATFSGGTRNAVEYTYGTDPEDGSPFKIASIKDHGQGSPYVSASAKGPQSYRLKLSFNARIEEDDLEDSIAVTSSGIYLQDGSLHVPVTYGPDGIEILSYEPYFPYEFENRTEFCYARFAFEYGSFTPGSEEYKFPTTGCSFSFYPSLTDNHATEDEDGNLVAVVPTKPSSIYLMAPSDVLYARVWYYEDALAQTVHGASAETIVYPPDFFTRPSSTLVGGLWETTKNLTLDPTTPVETEILESTLLNLSLSSGDAVGISAEVHFEDAREVEYFYMASKIAYYDVNNTLLATPKSSLVFDGNNNPDPFGERQDVAYINVPPEEIPANTYKLRFIITAQLQGEERTNEIDETYYPQIRAWVTGLSVNIKNSASVSKQPGPTAYEIAVTSGASSSSNQQTEVNQQQGETTSSTGIPLNAATPTDLTGVTQYDLAEIQLDAVDALLAAADAQDTADGKIVTFFQSGAPTAEGVGDIWFDTDDSNKPYRWNGSSWVAVQDGTIAEAAALANDAQATADGKITTFYTTSTPTADAVGDMWYNTATGILKRWSGSVWQDTADKTSTQTSANTEAVLDRTAAALMTDVTNLAAAIQQTGDETGGGGGGGTPGVPLLSEFSDTLPNVSATTGYYVAMIPFRIDAGETEIDEISCQIYATSSESAVVKIALFTDYAWHPDDRLFPTESSGTITVGPADVVDFTSLGWSGLNSTTKYWLIISVELVSAGSPVYLAFSQAPIGNTTLVVYVTNPDANHFTDPFSGAFGYATTSYLPAISVTYT